VSGLVAVLLVGVGGATGAVARYGVGVRLSGPLATLVVNVLGSATAGALLAADLPQQATAVAMIGFCGGFTTFSSFAVEVVDRFDRGERFGALRYAGATLATALFGAVLGAIAVGGL
jgi:CrcB protein